MLKRKNDVKNHEKNDTLKDRWNQWKKLEELDPNEEENTEQSKEKFNRKNCYKTLN